MSEINANTYFDRSFPGLGMIAESQLTKWLEYLVDEFLGNVPAILIYIKTIGWFTIPAWLEDFLLFLSDNWKSKMTNRDIPMPTRDMNGVTCAEAFASIGTNDCNKIAAGMKKHPIMAIIIERRCLAAYRNAHPTEAMGAIDWTKIITWITTNGPALMQFILQLIALFGG